jgi:chitinase
VPTNGTCLNYSTSDGTAVGGCDYTSVSGTLCFGAGVTSNSISIPVTLGCNATNQSATINLQLSNTNGNNVLNAVIILQRPPPVLAVYPAALTIFVPGNCGQFVTISNAGPAGSVLNYTLADNGALGGYLDFNDQGPASPATGSLLAGQSTQVTITVLDPFATNWIGGTLITAPSIYTPGAANYVKYPLSVTISPNLTIDPAPPYDPTAGPYYGINGWPYASAAMDFTYATSPTTSGEETNSDTQYLEDQNNGGANASASNYGVTLNASSSSSVITNDNSITLNASGSGSVVYNFPANSYPDGASEVLAGAKPVIYFTLGCSSGYTLSGTLSETNDNEGTVLYSGSSVTAGSAYVAFELQGGEDIYYSGAPGNFSQTGTLTAGSYVIYLDVASDNYEEPGYASIPVIGTYSSSGSGNVTLTLTPNP